MIKFYPLLMHSLFLRKQSESHSNRQQIHLFGNIKH